MWGLHWFSLVALLGLTLTLVPVAEAARPPRASPAGAALREPGGLGHRRSEPEPAATAPRDLVDRLVGSLTVRQKVGQVLMVGFEGTAPSADVRRLIGAYGIGNVELLGWNVRNARQVAELTAALRRSARDAGQTLPLLIGIDQEGGWITRVREGATNLPGNMALGATGDTTLAYEAGQLTAADLRGMGVNVDFAPVLDVNTNAANPIIGVRSFGDDPAAAGRLGVAFAFGLQRGGILGVGKHFPGHGAVSADSHRTLPVDRSPRDVIEHTHLGPFRAAVQSGLGAVMAAHVVYPALDPDRPASLSPTVIGLLRRDLAFDGLVLTDDLAMAGARTGQSAADAALSAVLAGADLVLVGGPTERQLAVYERLHDAVQSGGLPAARLDEAVRRVVAAKLRFGANGGDGVEFDGPSVARDIAERALTVLHSPPSLPRSGDRLVVVTPDVVPAPRGWTVLGTALAARGFDVTEVRAVAARDPGLERARANALAALGAAARAGRSPDGDSAPAQPADAAVVATWDVGPAQRGLVRALVSRGKPVTVVSLGSPYDLLALPPDAGLVAVYGYAPAQLEATAAWLAGALRPSGRLPVALSAAFPRGFGLEPR